MTAASGIQPSLLVRPLAEHAVVHAWFHLLSLFKNLSRPAAPTVIDSIFSIIRHTAQNRKRLPEFLIHHFADMALKELVDSRIQVGRDSKLWEDVTNKIYSHASSSGSRSSLSSASSSRPSSPLPCNVGLLILGLKALIIRPTGDSPDEEFVPGALPKGLPLDQLVPFLSGLLARLEDTKAGPPPSPKPFLFFCDDILTRLCDGAAVSATEHAKVVLRVLPSFAACRGAEEFQSYAEGEFIIGRWSNCFSLFLTRICKLVPHRTHVCLPLFPLSAGLD